MKQNSPAHTVQPAQSSAPTLTTRQRHLGRAVQIIDRVCSVADSPDFTNELQVNGSKLRGILQRRDNPGLFNWLVDAFSHQGVSDALASGYIERNGSLTWNDVATGLSAAACPKLASFWRFENCGYTKGSGLCSEPSFRPACSLPTAVLRNGRLNQLGYALFLFTRDVADGDLIGWIDARIQDELKQNDDLIMVGRTAVIEPMLGIYGVADKVLMMAFADLLMSAPARYRHWFEVGSAMIAVDNLVHAFLARTGIIGTLGE